METEDRIKKRIQLLRSICDGTNFDTSKHVNYEYLEKNNPDLATEFILKEILTLHENGQVNGYPVHYQGTKIIKNISPTAIGINLIERVDMADPNEAESNKNTTTYNIENMSNSNIVNQSRNVHIEQNISGSEELLKNIANELTKENSEEISKILELLKIKVESKTSTDVIKGILASLESISYSVYANLITPIVGFWLGINVRF